MNGIAHRDVLPDAINHVLENLSRASASSESDGRAHLPVLVGAGIFDHANVLICVVVDQKRPAIRKTLEPDAFGFRI